MLFTIQIEAASMEEALTKLNFTGMPTPQLAHEQVPGPCVPPVQSAAPAPSAPRVYATAQQAYPSAAPQLAAPPPSVAPTQAPVYTEDELMRAAGTLMDSGKGPQLQQLLAGMGVQYLGQLPKDRYGEFAAALKGMGAKL